MSAYTLSALELEDILEDACLCESSHIGTASLHCDILATYRLTVKCQKQSGLICASLAHADADFMVRRNTFCILCNEPASKCWTVTTL